MEIILLKFIKTEFFAMVFVLSLSFIIRVSTRSTVFVWLIKFPGMVLHEVAHLIVGIFTLAKPTKIVLLPKRQADGSIVLGSVSFAKINNFNAFWISMAPLVLMIISYYIYIDNTIMNWIYEVFKIEQYWIKRIVTLYLLTILLSSSIPSSVDFKVMLSKYVGSMIWIVLILYFTWDMIKV